MVFRSTNAGQSWQAISSDLTRNDKTKQQPSGGPITLDITSVEYYDTVFALAESPLMKGMLWAGTDDGLVHVTTNGGERWEKGKAPRPPRWGLVLNVPPSPPNPAAG